jgi:alanyl-tRNA synthetase
LKKSSEIRDEFLNFFKEKGHKIVPSAPVIPYNDPTLLFTNAGMNQFKDIFLGNGKRDYNRCVDTQKCIRVSGKHNDLEEVGHDGYHHTFFEMLGNWSFGEYYKKEAIRWAWELFTAKWNLPKDKLWVTVFTSDDESFNYWKTETDIDHGHIIRFGEKDNFWEMGETGPCGPCSEIHIDLTELGCKAEDINMGEPNEIELWNLVFIQYNRDEKGVLHELPQKHVDTGMGFERIVRVLQNKRSNYETDVFLPLIDELIQITGKDYTGEKFSSAMNVIADHIRALTFAIADGAMPSNEGRGYVLRRILRRAARYGRNLGMHKPFIYKLVDVLSDTMGNVFPEITEKRKFIKEVIQAEEESFNETLDRGLVYFNGEIEKMKKEGSKVFSGDVAFKLHDTYGFPIDLTQLMARELGFVVNSEKFDELMKVQRERSRVVHAETGHLILTGYDLKIDVPEREKRVIYDPYNIKKDGIKTRILDEKLLHTKNKIVFLDTNPFYSESGGQVSDTGKLIIDNETVNVLDSKKDYIIIDKIDFIFPKNTEVIAQVDFGRRLAVQRNHSATHLVHEALRRVLGEHVRQMGSYLDDKILRFDFTHYHKLTPQQIIEIEDIVNSKIQEKISVNWDELPIGKAEKIPNVKRFFGEKYGENVRVVFIDEKFSVEFCGGTHVKDTSDIGLFKILKEESVSSGVRRIFARTGEGIIKYLGERSDEIEKIINELPEKYSQDLKPSIIDLKKGIAKLNFKDSQLLRKLIDYQDSTLTSLYELHDSYVEEKKQIEKQLTKDKLKKAASLLDDLINNSTVINDTKLISSSFDVDSMEELKDLGDILRQKMKRGIGLLYSIIDGKVNIVTVITDNLVKEKDINAGKIANDIAKILGGGGGGRSHLATAGGKDLSKLNEAVSQFPNIVNKYLK